VSKSYLSGPKNEKIFHPKKHCNLGLVVVLSWELAGLFCKDSTKQMAGGPSPCTQRSTHWRGPIPTYSRRLATTHPGLGFVQTRKFTYKR